MRFVRFFWIMLRGGLPNKLTETRYTFVDTVMTWSDAKKHCESRGESLAVPRNREEQKLVFDQVPKSSIGRSWLGITDQASEGKWVDLNGQEVAYLAFNKVEPNGGTVENCINLHYNDHQNTYDSWNDEECSDLRSFVCQKPAVTTPSPYKWGPPKNDWRCGARYEADCEADGGLPCCSRSEWCGNTRQHCECLECVDFRKLKKTDTATTTNPTTTTTPATKPTTATTTTTSTSTTSTTTTTIITTTSSITTTTITTSTTTITNSTSTTVKTTPATTTTIASNTTTITSTTSSTVIKTTTNATDITSLTTTTNNTTTTITATNNTQTTTSTTTTTTYYSSFSNYFTEPTYSYTIYPPTTEPKQTTAVVTPSFPDDIDGAKKQYFQLTVKVKTTIEWDINLTDPSSALFRAKASIITKILTNRKAMSEKALGFKLAMEVLKFLVSAGRKQAAEFAEATIQYSGETSFPNENTAPALQKALVAATNAAAEDNDILFGAAVVEEELKNNSFKLIPSILTLFISIVFLTF